MKKRTQLMTLASLLLASAPALAEEAVANAAAHGAAGTAVGWIAMAAGLAIGVAALGGTLGQGKAAAAALDGIARNPAASGKLFIPLLLSLALIESLVIYALVIAFSLNGQITAFASMLAK